MSGQEVAENALSLKAAATELYKNKMFHEAILLYAKAEEHDQNNYVYRYVWSIWALSLIY